MSQSQCQSEVCRSEKVKQGLKSDRVSVVCRPIFGTRVLCRQFGVLASTSVVREMRDNKMLMKTLYKVVAVSFH